MIKIVAENYIKEEHQKEFLKLTKELIILSREETGNIWTFGYNNGCILRRAYEPFHLTTEITKWHQIDNRYDLTMIHHEQWWREDNLIEIAQRSITKGNEEKSKKFPTMKSLDADKKASKVSKAAPAKVAEKVDFSNVKIEQIFEELVGKTAIAIVNLPPRKMYRFTK